MFSWLPSRRVSTPYLPLSTESRRGSAATTHSEGSGAGSPIFDVDPASFQLPSRRRGSVDLEDEDGEEKYGAQGQGRRGSGATSITFSSSSDDGSSTCERYVPDPATIRRHRRCLALVLSVVALLVVYLASTTNLLSSTSASFSRLSGHLPFASSASNSSSALSTEQERFTPRCTPKTYSSGRWVPRSPSLSNLTSPSSSSSIWTSTGWTGCAQSWFRTEWQLGLTAPLADGGVMSEYRRRAGGYRWEAGGGEGVCDGVEEGWEEEDTEEETLRLLQDLVDRGGWLIVGDSISEQHFFSLSCALYPHVKASWPFPPMSEWKQIKEEHLFLDPEGPLVSSGRLRVPEGWDWEGSAVVSHVRSDHGLSPLELVDLSRTFFTSLPSNTILSTLYPTLSALPVPSPPSALLTPIESFSPTLRYILSLFLHPSSPRSPLAQPGEEALLSPAYAAENTPQTALDAAQKATRSGRYRALLFSTGAHFSSRHFNLGPSPFSAAAQIEFFSLALRAILDRTAAALAEAGDEAAGKEVLVRPTSNGHDDCHGEWTAKGPLEGEEQVRASWFSWPEMQVMNEKAESITASLSNPQITFLDLARPGKLRPDAHTNDDCLHLSVGSGVVEGWTHYTSYFLREKAVWEDERRAGGGGGTWKWLSGLGW
ncbi:hypothetical protein JCM10213_002933 [Rhodosporidiobolus nylandii]